MMLGYLVNKPPGGGPAPLLHNPVRKWILLLVVLHMVLFLVAAASFAFPSMGDLYCVDLLDNSTYCAVCAAVAFAMIFYFSLLSCRAWGTEREWAVATLITMSMAIADLVTAGWGMFVLVTSSKTLIGSSSSSGSGSESSGDAAEEAAANDATEEGTQTEDSPTEGGDDSTPSTSSTGGCDDWKAYFFYYATAVVITAHVTVAVSCATVAVFLTRGVGTQLEEIRHLV